MTALEYSRARRREAYAGGTVSVSQPNWILIFPLVSACRTVQVVGHIRIFVGLPGLSSYEPPFGAQSFAPSGRRCAQRWEATAAVRDRELRPSPEASRLFAAFSGGRGSDRAPARGWMIRASDIAIGPGRGGGGPGRGEERDDRSPPAVAFLFRYPAGMVIRSFTRVWDRKGGIAAGLSAIVAAAIGLSGAGCGVLLGLDGYAPATCDDKVKSGEESDVDCGGPACGGCEAFQGCRAPTDCLSGVCAAGQCAAPACDDGVRNGAETDLDCGGGECGACADSKLCAAAKDCASGVCSGGACAAPVCDDTVANGEESDVDCGGGACAGCVNGMACVTGADCVSGGCPGGACGAWAKALGGPMAEGGTSVTIDSTGEILVAGLFRDTVNLGGEDLVSDGMSDIFVARYSREGGHIWSKRFGGPQDDSGRITLDGSGDILLVGAGTDVNFGGGALGEPGARILFVAKLLGKTGADIWSKGFPASEGTSAAGASAGPSGDVYVCGTFDFAQFAAGGNTLIHKGGVDGFIAKFSGINGKYLWSRSFGGSGDDIAMGAAATADGSVVIAGSFLSPTMDIGAASLSNNGSGSFNIFMAKIPGTGAGEQWSKSYGVEGSEGVMGLAVDPGGDIFLTGTISGVGAVGGSTIDSQSLDGFVARYDGGSGAHLWSSYFQGPEHEMVYGLALDGEGNALVTGNTQSDYVDFGGGPVTNPGAPQYDIFIAKYAASTGSHLFSTAFGSGLTDFGFGVAASKATGNVVIAGVFQSVMTVGGAQIESAGLSDGFVASLGGLP